MISISTERSSDLIVGLALAAGTAVGAAIHGSLSVGENNVVP